MIYCFVDYDQLYDLRERQLPILRQVENTSVNQIGLLIFRPDMLSILMSTYTDFKTLNIVNTKEKRFADKVVMDERFTETEMMELKRALLKKVRAKVKPEDTLLFESIRQVAGLYTHFYNFYSDYLLNGSYNVMFVREPYLNSSVYTTVISLLNTDITTTFLKAQFKGVYSSLKMKDHELLKSQDDWVLKPGDNKKRRDEIREYVIRNYHEAFCGYCNNRQVAEMLVNNHGFKQISARTVARTVSEMLAETGKGDRK